jgi:tetratricopeptide (TPR) repeat protein
MNVLIPLLLLGGAVGVAFSGGETKVAAPPTPSPMAASELGLGGYLQGIMADMRQDPASAKTGYLAALADDPDNLNLRQRTLELTLADGDVVTALRLAKTLPASNQTFLSRLLMVVNAQAQGQPDEAMAALRPLVAQVPNLAVVQGLQAYIGYSKGVKIPKLAAAWEGQRATPTQNAQRWVHIARLWLKEGNQEQAKKALQQALAINPGSLRANQMLLDILLRAGDLSSAASLDEAFKVRNPGLHPLLVMSKTPPPPFASTPTEDIATLLSDFGLLLWSEGALNPALQVLNLTIWLLPAGSPESELNLFYRAAVEESLGQTANASKSLAMLAHTTNPGLDLLVRLRQAEIAFQQPKQQKQALAKVKALAKANPQIDMVQHTLAQMAQLTEDYQLAIQAYSTLLASHPSNTNIQAAALFGRGAAYERLGNIAAAEADLNASLLHNPANAQALNYLGYLWVDQNRNLEKAYAMLKRAHLLQPDDGAITDSVGWAYYRKGDYETARQYLEQAAEQEPGTPEILAHLADTYAKLGKWAEARKLWQRALDLAAQGATVPTPDFISQTRAKLKTNP